MTADLTGWDGIVAAALVGTERRTVPEQVLASLGVNLETAETGNGASPRHAQDGATGSATVPGSATGPNSTTPGSATGPSPTTGPSSATAAEDPAPAGGTTSTAEARVLTAAAVLAPYRLAGWQPPAFARPIDATAEPEHRPQASDGALQLLDLLVSGQAGGVVRTELSIEWLTRCDACGLRVPRQALPRLLETATADRQLRPRAAAVVGTTGRWLAERNPAWSWVIAAQALTSEDAAGTWRTGTTAERREALRALRAHDPAAGRELLQSSWRSESATARAELLIELMWNLEDADEPFLEACLDDRSTQVRKIAIGALNGLPASRFAQRMAERTVPLVRSSGRLRPRLTIDLPGEPDESARRDLALSRSSTRTSELREMLRATPLAVWQERFGLPPDELVARARESDLLLDGWSGAVRAQHNGEWARALLAHEWTVDLVHILPPDERGPHVVRACEDETIPDDRVARLLAQVPRPWPEEVTVEVLARAKRRAKDLRRRAGPAAEGLGAMLRRAARGMAPEAAPLVESWLRESGIQLPAARDLLHALILRQAMLDRMPIERGDSEPPLAPLGDHPSLRSGGTEGPAESSGPHDRLPLLDEGAGGSSSPVLPQSLSPAGVAPEHVVDGLAPPPLSTEHVEEHR